jgi:ferrous iron transport protein B
MSCGAKLPVYALLAGTFFMQRAGNVVIIVYGIGVALALASSWVFRRTILRGETSPFVMELPPYRMPTLVGLLWHVRDKTEQYIKKAGTVLLAASILIWVTVTFPRPVHNNVQFSAAVLEYIHQPLHAERIRAEVAGTIADGKAREAVVAQRVSSDAQAYAHAEQKRYELAHSMAGCAGRFIEPLVKPLGFDWKIAIAAVTGFAAKEAVVSTLGVLYNVGSSGRATLSESLHADRMFNPLVAFVFMLFTLIAPPCVAALNAIRAEAGMKWLGFSFTYSVFVSWLLCFFVYQTGRLLGWGM